MIQLKIVFFDMWLLMVPMLYFSCAKNCDYDIKKMYINNINR